MAKINLYVKRSNLVGHLMVTFIEKNVDRIYYFGVGSFFLLVLLFVFLRSYFLKEILFAIIILCWLEPQRPPFEGGLVRSIANTRFFNCYGTVENVTFIVSLVLIGFFIVSKCSFYYAQMFSKYLIA